MTILKEVLELGTFLPCPYDGGYKNVDNSIKCQILRVRYENLGIFPTRGDGSYKFQTILLKYQQNYQNGKDPLYIFIDIVVISDKFQVSENFH